MTVTDNIYQELMDTLQRGLDCTEVMSKYSHTKGPAYNALGRAIRGVLAQMAALTEERKQTLKELDDLQQKRESLKHEVDEAASKLSTILDEGYEMGEQLQQLEGTVSAKTELLSELDQVKRLGFQGEKLRQLRDALTEIGAKCGLRGADAVARFFDHLRDYGAILQAEVDLEALRKQIESKKLEAEEWQAREEALRRKHDDVREALSAIRSFSSRGIRVAQIVTWHRVLSRFGTLEGFEESLTQYGDMAALVNAKKEETESCELRLTQIQGQVKALQKEKAKTEAAIEAIEKSAVNKVKETGEAVQRQIADNFATIAREWRELGKEVAKQLANHWIQLDALEKKLFRIGQKYGELKRELERYDSLKDVLESH